MKKGLLVLLFGIIISCLPLHGQIRNRMDVRNDIYLRYANGRLQQYNPENIPLADSIYAYGQLKNDARYKALALSLEMPVRHMEKDTGRVCSIASEMKSLMKDDKRIGDFYYITMYDYCNFQILSGRISDAMLEARDMSRRASEENRPVGQMYAYRIIGTIQAYRTNSELAVRNYEKAVKYCLEAKEEQELPVIYLLICNELVRLHRYDAAAVYCAKAKEFQDFYPQIKVKAAIAEALMYYSKGDMAAFSLCYRNLQDSPLYRVQTDSDTRNMMDVYWSLSQGKADAALASAYAVTSDRNRFEQLHTLYALTGDYLNAYGNLKSLMETKDSILIAVQNEDMAILDAELGNAQLRLEAQKLKSQNETAIMLGFLLLFLLATGSLMVTQWILNINLNNMRQKNKEALAARESYRRSLDAMEMEINMRIRILQNNRK